MDTKKWYQSLTIQIGILTALAGLVPLILDLLKVLNPAWGEVATAIGVFVLGLLQIIRRFALDPENPPSAIVK